MKLDWFWVVLVIMGLALGYAIGTMSSTQAATPVKAVSPADAANWQKVVYPLEDNIGAEYIIYTGPGYPIFSKYLTLEKKESK